MSFAMPLVYPVTCHTDFVGKGSIFVVIKGHTTDGMLFVKDAVLKGARTIVIEESIFVDSELLSFLKMHQVALLRVVNTRQALALMSAEAAGNPAQLLKIFAITGTKGKTTSCFLLRSILKQAGFKTALLTTAHNSILDIELETHLTTPQPDYIHQFLKLCVQAGVTHVVMEVAAQALSLFRVEGILFDGIIMTNFAREHLEFYSTLDDYLAAKITILNHAKNHAPIVINQDDTAFKKIVRSGVIFFSCKDKNALFYGQYIKGLDHSEQRHLVHKNALLNLKTDLLVGFFNFYNIMGVATLAFSLGIEPKIIEIAVARFKGVPGRFERYTLYNGSTCFIDSAHNPLSFEAFLSVVRPMTNHLIVVFGAGGDRDPGRRPIMGAIVERYADIMIITSDNPRSEDPKKIAQEILVGVLTKDHNKINVILDRKKAVLYALSQAKQSSIVALLGKGSQCYQIFKTHTELFSEASIISEFNTQAG